MSLSYRKGKAYLQSAARAMTYATFSAVIGHIVVDDVRSPTRHCPSVNRWATL